MGLFDDVLKNVGDIVDKEMGEDAKKILGELGDAIKEAQANQPVQKEEAAPAADEAIYEEDGEPCDKKIRECLASEFPQYTVKENVSPTTIGGTGKFMDYSFGIYDSDKPKLFIMLVGKTTCSTRLYRWSKEQAAAAGVTMINFVKHYPNNPEYIKERLHKYL